MTGDGRAVTAGACELSEGDIVGVVESPAPLQGPVTGRTLLVSGWALCPAGINALTLSCDEGTPVAAQTGLARPDVAAIFADLPTARRAGFLGLLDTATLAVGRHRLAVSASSAAGTRRRWELDFEVGSRNDAYAAWRSRHGAHPSALPGGPALGRSARAVMVSVIVDVADAAEIPQLWRTLQSIDTQTHGRVEVVVRWGLQDAPAPVAGAAGTLGQAMLACNGRLVTLLTPGERLEPRALEIAVRNALAHPRTTLFYADHEIRSDCGRTRPVFKPGWSPLLFEQLDYIGHPWFADRTALQAAVAAGEADDDLDARRLVYDAAICAATVGHIPAVLLSRPHRDTPGPASERKPASRPEVSVVIPTCLARRDVLARCLDGLAATRAAYPALEVLVVLNNVASLDEATQFLSAWNVVPLHFDGSFNWSAINNAAAAQSGGELLLFMNDDVEPLDTSWLESMVALALREPVGAVGAVLRYPDGRIQHAGVHLSAGNHIECRHMFRFCHGDEPEVQALLQHDRDQTAVTGACLLTRRDVFEALGGFDERLALVFNDVDYGLRLAERGYRTVVAARAELVHHEGLSRGGLPETADEHFFAARWRGTLPPTDPFYNPHLRQDTDDWSLDPQAHSPPTARLSLCRGPSETPMSTDQAWKQWGQNDPYFGVITDEKYRAHNITPEAKQAFFASGRSHVQHVLAVSRKHLAHDFKPTRVLDFGCGVGRLVVPLAEQAEQVVGIDVSEGMLAEARRNCDAHGLQNVTLLPSDDRLSALEGTFDLIHSAIVFQHIDVPRGRNLFRLLLQRLAPQGIGVLQVTYAKDAYADNWGQPPARPDSAEASPQAKPRGLLNLLPLAWSGAPVTERSAPSPSHSGDPEMQMNTYNLNELLFMVQRLGVRKFHAEFSDHGGELGLMLYFQRP